MKDKEEGDLEDMHIYLPCIAISYTYILFLRFAVVVFMSISFNNDNNQQFHHNPATCK